MSRMLLAIPVFALLAAACARQEPEREIPPKLNTRQLEYFRDQHGACYASHDLGYKHGSMTAAPNWVCEAEEGRPPSYGDVGPEQPAVARCTTDTECMKFGGNGGPEVRL